jgi:nucleotidyltransferase substrate binding protein (TIGR01987 family)
MSKIALKRDKFKRALNALEAIYQLAPDQDRVLVDATIQRFEFSFELAWKFLKDFFLGTRLRT